MTLLAILQEKPFDIFEYGLRLYEDDRGADTAAAASFRDADHIEVEDIALLPPFGVRGECETMHNKILEQLHLEF